MRPQWGLVVACAAALATGCGDDDNNGDDDGPRIDAAGASDASAGIDAPAVDAGCVQAPRVGCGSAAGVLMQRFTDRDAFEAALADLCVQVIDFDDIDTSGKGPASFAADRYAASTGAVITGTDGQFADEAFSFPTDFVPTSAPNMYAPGPVNGVDDAGGFETDITFVDGANAGCVAGFGAVFIDADFPGIARSSLAAFSADDTQLDLNDTFDGANGSQLFIGVIATDDAGNLVPVISRVHLVNGNEWPERDTDEGVTLDDFVFDRPDGP